MEIGEGRPPLRGLQRIAKNDAGHRVDVEVRGPPTEEGCLQRLSRSDEVLPFQKLEDGIDPPTDEADIRLVSIESPVHELLQLLLGLDVACGNGGEEVHPEGRFPAELGFDGLGTRQDVVLQHLLHVLLVARKEHRLPVLVVLRPAGPTAHLFDLQNRDVVEAVVGVIAAHVSDDGSPGGNIHPGSQRWSRDDALQVMLSEEVLHKLPMAVCQAGIVKCRATLQVAGQSASYGGGFLLAARHLPGGFGEGLHVLRR